MPFIFGSDFVTVNCGLGGECGISAAFHNYLGYRTASSQNPFADLLRSGWGSGKVQQCRREMSSAFCQGQGRSAVPGSYRGFEAAGGSMKKDPGVAAPKGPGWD